MTEESGEGRMDAPAKKERAPRTKAVTLIRGYTDNQGKVHKPGDEVHVSEAESRRLVVKLRAAHYA